MRSPSAAALSVALAATFLAGCSTSPQSAANLPASTDASQSVVSRQAATPEDVRKPMNQLKLLKLQAEGKLPGPVPQSSSRYAYRYLQTHSAPHFTVKPDGETPKIWASNTDFDYLVGQNGSGTQTVTAVNTTEQGCYDPITVKTDAGGNVWTACLYNSSFYGGFEQEYTSTGAPATAYVWTPPSGSCPASAFECFASQYDGGPDGLGHVYAELSLNQYFTCENYSCTYYIGTPGFFWFNENSPSESPTFIPVSGSGSLVVTYVYYMATDSAGNIWFDYTGCQGVSSCGAGLAEIQNPTTAPVFVPVLPIGTYGFPGGLAIHGTTLAVTDQANRTTYLYHLPVTPSSSAYGTLGPTATGISGEGDPVTGNFNKSGSGLIQADSLGWLDVTKTKTNGQKAALNINYLPAIEGAAYAP